MLRSQIRTSIVALVATSSFAAMSVVPTVSQASKNTGAYSKSAEATKKRDQAIMCQSALDSLNADLQALANAHASGDQAAINKAREEANSDYLWGYEGGCAWASHMLPPESPTSGLAPPAGGITASPEATLPPVMAVQATSLAPAR
jgi:hypothetical protein